MSAKRASRRERTNKLAEKENQPSAPSSTVEGSYMDNNSSTGTCYPRNTSCAVSIKETFVPFNGTIEELKDNPAFQQMVERHSFVLVKPGATHCSRPGRNDSRARCEKGVVISTFD